MSLLNELENLGVDVNDALKRFMNNSSLYEKMLGKLVATVKNMEVMSFLDSGDTEKATANAHTLKGVMGNLSITPLYEAYNEIVALLRGNEPDKAKSVLEDILPVQKNIINCIEKNK